MEKTKKEMTEDLEKRKKKLGKIDEEKEEIEEEEEKRDEEEEKRDEEEKDCEEELEQLEERGRETVTMKFQTLHIGKPPSKMSVSELQGICEQYEKIFANYTDMNATREVQMGLQKEYAEEVRYQEIKAELAKLEPEYKDAKHQLALPSKIARYVTLWSNFKEEEILRIPARLFGTLFKDESVQPESAIDGMIIKKAKGISMSFSKETVMNKAVMFLLESTGFDFEPESRLMDDKTQMGRMDVFCHVDKEPVVIVEGKLLAGGDPLVQGLAGYKLGCAKFVEYLAKVNKKPRQDSFPCLIITTNGEVFTVYGALTLQTEERKERRQGPGISFSFIRAFSVRQSCDAVYFISWLKKKMEDLKSWQSSPSPSVLSCFPHDCVPEVIFKQHLRDSLFEGRMKDSNKKCIVKFLFNGYGKEVHEHCASFNYAPKILKTDSTSADGSSPIVIVMEKNETFKTLCDSLEQKKVEAPEKVCENLRNAVEAMQTKGFVHGNIRPPNVLSNNQGDVWLIDFDWAGREGHPNVTYPYPPGAAFGEKIKMEHDTNMMEEVISQIRSIR